MIDSRVLLSLLIALFLGIATVTATAIAAPQQQTSEAASLYERGDYGPAYKQYLKLAKQGDAFAQYRVSYMHLMGLGTRENVVESVAWAVVAARTGPESLNDYQDAVAALVPAKQRKKAQKKADYYLRRWGPDEIEDNGTGAMARSSDGGCTGSRLARNCGNSASGGGYWIPWGADRSGDPQQKAGIEALNESILNQSAELNDGVTG